MTDHIVSFPQRMRMGTCKACRRIVLVESDTIKECPHVGCGAIGRLVFKWVDFRTGFRVVRAFAEDDETS